MSRLHELSFGHGSAAFALPIYRICGRTITLKLWVSKDECRPLTCRPPSFHVYPHGLALCACGGASR